MTPASSEDLVSPMFAQGQPHKAGAAECTALGIVIVAIWVTWLSRGCRFEFKLSPGQVPLAMNCAFVLRPSKGIFVTPRLRETTPARA